MSQRFLQFRLGQLLLLFVVLSLLLSILGRHLQQWSDEARRRNMLDRMAKAEADLMRAVHEDNLSLAQQALDCGFTLDQITASRDFPLLHLAVWRGQLAIVGLLIEAGASVNGVASSATFAEGGTFLLGTPLVVAIRSQRPKEQRIAMMRLLVQHGANPLLPVTPAAIDEAVRQADGSAGALLRELGVPIGPREMAAFNWLSELKPLVRENPELLRERYAPEWNAWEGQGPTLLGIALRRGHRETAQWLIESGAPLDTIEYLGESLLVQAALGGDVELTRMLIDRGLDLNHRRDDGRSALSCAAARGHLGVVDQLLASGAAVDLPDRNRRTPLFFAVLDGHRDTAARLLDAGADPNARDAFDCSILELGRLSRNQAIADLLEGADGEHRPDDAGAPASCR